jgi:OmcA/MtrC family decaheme c-type cytochrome
MTEPSRAACGACHDNVNFATGLNHPAGFQADDTQCATCHVPKGSPFDASILGAHVVPADTALSYPQNPDTLITGDAIHITGVTNTSAGQKPVVAFTVKDTLGNPLAMSALEDLSFTMAGPTIDYGYTSFGSDVTTPGIVTEDGTVATCDASSNCTYTFLYAIPAKSTGTYAVAVESERLENILAGTTSTQQVESGTANQVVYFSVDGSAVANRRTVVQKANCNRCHVNLQGHGARRNDPEYCILCHNPSLTDAATRAMSTKPADLNAPALGLDFDFMVHRIHTGVNLAAMGASYLEISHNGREVSFNGILYPAMSPAGAATYTQNCAICHVNSSEQNLPTSLNQVTSPQYWFTPVGAVSAACSGCHASKPEASHFLANTDSLGESCSVCHAAGAQYAVDAVHTP